MSKVQVSPFEEWCGFEEKHPPHLWGETFRQRSTQPGAISRQALWVMPCPGEKFPETEEDSPIILRNLAKAIVDRITPEEPTGVGATVRDDEGHIAIRNRTGGRWDWWITDIGWCEWGKDFTVSTEEQILSHGVRMGP